MTGYSIWLMYTSPTPNTSKLVGRCNFTQLCFPARSNKGLNLITARLEAWASLDRSTSVRYKPSATHPGVSTCSALVTLMLIKACGNLVSAFLDPTGDQEGTHRAKTWVCQPNVVVFQWLSRSSRCEKFVDGLGTVEQQMVINFLLTFGLPKLYTDLIRELNTNTKEDISLLRDPIRVEIQRDVRRCEINSLSCFLQLLRLSCAISIWRPALTLTVEEFSIWCSLTTSSLSVLTRQL